MLKWTRMMDGSYLNEKHDLRIRKESIVRRSDYTKYDWKWVLRHETLMGAGRQIGIYRTFRMAKSAAQEHIEPIDRHEMIDNGYEPEPFETIEPYRSREE